jgi:tetratricopeptide (TPR) repeat protein
VNAEEQGSLAAGLAAVAEAAGLAVRGGGDPGLAVRHWLEGDGDRRLVVFDNAVDADALRPYVPAAGGARVVITSNWQSLAALGDRVGVEVFTPAEATAYLAQRTGLTDATGATAVAAELGYLPLGLAQAAAVISTQRLGYTTYLERLREFPLRQYLTREAGQAYPHGVAEAVLLSLQTVAAGDESGVRNQILEIMSVLSAAGVRRDMLHAVTDPAMADAALGRLAEASLVSFSVDGQTVTAHRLVLRVVRDRLIAAERLGVICQAAAEVLGIRASTLAGAVDRMAVRDIPEQVTALTEAAASLPGEPVGLAAPLLALRFWALYHLNELGDSARQAITVGEPLVSDRERVLGPNHPDTLNAENSLAIAYLMAGRVTEAIALYEQVLAAREQLLGPDHPDTLKSRNNLANAYRAAGRTTEAITLHEQALAAHERVLGPDHPDTLKSRNNLANAYGTAGRATEAITLHEQALATRARILGPDHPDTLNTRDNLANAYRAAGRTTEAIALHEQALAGYERVLGPDHPDTLSSRYNLANAYRAAGRTTEAIALYEQALAGYERVLGPDHSNTLNTRNNLAIAYQAAGRTTEAITLHEQALAARERVLGPDHPDTQRSRNNLASAREALAAGESRGAGGESAPARSE